MQQSISTSFAAENINQLHTEICNVTHSSSHQTETEWLRARDFILPRAFAELLVGEYKRLLLKYQYFSLSAFFVVVYVWAHRAWNMSREVKLNRPRGNRVSCIMDRETSQRAIATMKCIVVIGITLDSIKFVFNGSLIIIRVSDYGSAGERVAPVRRFRRILIFDSFWYPVNGKVSAYMFNSHRMNDFHLEYSRSFPYISCKMNSLDGLVVVRLVWRFIDVECDGMHVSTTSNV